MAGRIITPERQPTGNGIAEVPIEKLKHPACGVFQNFAVEIVSREVTAIGGLAVPVQVFAIPTMRGIRIQMPRDSGPFALRDLQPLGAFPGRCLIVKQPG